MAAPRDLRAAAQSSVGGYRPTRDESGAKIRSTCLSSRATSLFVEVDLVDQRFVHRIVEPGARLGVLDAGRGLMPLMVQRRELLGDLFEHTDAIIEIGAHGVELVGHGLEHLRRLLQVLLERVGGALTNAVQHEPDQQDVFQVAEHPANPRDGTAGGNHVQQSACRRDPTLVVDLRIFDNPQHGFQVLTETGQCRGHQLNEALARHITSEPENGPADMLPQLRWDLRRFR